MILNKLSKFLRRSLMIFIIKGFRTILSSSLLLFLLRFDRYVPRSPSGNRCLNFWDEAWSLLSLRVFGLLSSSLLLFFHNFSAAVSLALKMISQVESFLCPDKQGTIVRKLLLIKKKKDFKQAFANCNAIILLSSLVTMVWCHPIWEAAVTAIMT